MPTLQVITLGCSKNTVDTEHLLYQVRNAYEIVPEEEVRPVDVQLINTCGFIGDAKEQSIQTILASVQRKKDGEIGRLLVFGCLSQRYSREMPDLIPEVDGWFGARDLDPVVRALGCRPDPASAHRRVRTDGIHPYAYLKISEGCDRRCSYCAIPLIRGPHKSVPMDTLVREAEELAAQGVRELVIIAQDTTYYGLDLYGKRSLAELLRRLSAVEGIEWLRIHYSYPADFPEDVLDEMADNPKVCRYMDIPLQHIADPVLDRMRRHVDGAWTRELIRRMREKVPGVVLRTTLIVGHPGETPYAFRQLLQFVEEARFERLGAFAYSEEGLHLFGGGRNLRGPAFRRRDHPADEENASFPPDGTAAWHFSCIQSLTRGDGSPRPGGRLRGRRLRMPQRIRKPGGGRRDPGEVRAGPVRGHRALLPGRQFLPGEGRLRRRV